MTLTGKGLQPLTRTEAPESLLSATTITIGADTDSNGSGTIDLQTRTLTRLQITNAGNVYVANKIGINKTVPISALHIDATYAIDTTTSEYPIRLRPPTGLGDFIFMLNTTMFGAQNDDVVWWGWNIDSAIGGEPSIHFAMEREFGDDFEVHMEADPTSAAICRYWTWNIDRATGVAGHTIRADTLNISYPYSAEPNPTAAFSTTAVTIYKPLSAFNTTFLTSTAAIGVQIKEHAGDASKGMIVIGDDGATGAPRLSGMTGGLRVRVTNDSTNGAVFATAFRSIGGTGTTDVQALTSDGLMLNSAGLIRWEPTTNPFGGAPDCEFSRNGVAIIQAMNPQTGTAATVLGLFNTPASGTYKVNGTQVVGTRQGAVADATDAASVITQLNAWLAHARTHGLIAP